MGCLIYNLLGDLDADKDYIFGNDFDIDDIIWMGPQPSVKDLAAKAGVGNTDTLKTLQSLVANAVKKGQKVNQGDIIGTVGKTGRSTGPHLDIRLNWFDVKLDPSSILSN